jgi:hypothetical protein
MDPSSAQWLPEGVTLTPGYCSQDLPHAASGPAGSAYFVWRDLRDYSTTQSDIYAQRILLDGQIAPGWPTEGIAVSRTAGDEVAQGITEDGLGGLLVLWRTPAFGGDSLALRRILPSGEDAAGWPAGGVTVVTGDFRLAPNSLCSDGAGGAYVVWESASSSWIQHVLATGEIAPAWPTAGRLLVSQFAGSPRVLPDGSGGVLVMFQASAPDGPGDYAIRLTAGGAVAAGWTPGGRRVIAGAKRWDYASIAPDGNGGAFAAWTDYRTSPISPPHDGSSFDIYGQSIPGDGGVAAGWPLSGVPLCTSPSYQDVPDIAGDGSGGAIAVWRDGRDGVPKPYGLRITPSGAPAPGWSNGGVALTTRSASEVLPRVARNGADGLIALWSANQAGQPAGLYAQQLDAVGQLAAGWPTEGREVASPSLGDFGEPLIIDDGTNHPIVASRRNRPAPSCRQIVAHVIGSDAPVPVSITLIDAIVDADRVELRWFAYEGNRINATVERRAIEGEWVTIGSARSSARDEISFVDTGIAPGRYAYRLVYATGPSFVRSAETWVEVVASSRAHHLAGFVPNPAVGAAFVRFTLVDDGPAHLTVHDLRGRRRFARDVGQLGAGSHALELSKDLALPPGMYFIRLRRGPETLTRIGIVMGR